MSDIRSATENLYAAFSDVPKPEALGACPCCMTADELDTLTGKPLRELTGDELSSYASSALLTVGYFLPRILETSILDDSWWPDIEVTARAVKDTQLSSWPAERKAALVRFLEAAIRHLIESKAYYELDGWMCAVARIGFEVQPFLPIIESSEDAVLEFFNRNSGKLHEGKLSNAFWELPNLGHDAIVAWLRSDKISGIAFRVYGYKI